MRDHRPQLNSELIRCLSENIRNKASILASLNQEIHAILPHSENICRVANYRDGILVLECASSAWAMRLNGERPMLISKLRQSKLTSLTTIEIKINPTLAQAEIERYRKFVPPKAPISKQSANYLITLASCTSEKIAKKLKSIAKLAE